MSIDWIHKLSPLLAGGWEITPTNRIKPKEAMVEMVKDLPWIYSNVLFDCTVWNKVFHVVVTEKRLVHSHCHNCIKVVGKPKTLHDLVVIEAIQSSMLFPCKCGIDRRDNTQDIYGAFWYNRGFDEARMRFRILRKRLNDEGLEHVPLIIKKACTEFENEMGPSSKWEKPTPEQLGLERDLDNVLDYEPQPPVRMPDLLTAHTHQLWIHWAFQHGDDTYLEFTNRERIHEPLVTYNPKGRNK